MKADTQQRHYLIVEKALAYLNTHQQHQPGLEMVASHCGMSETHFQKVFKQWAGVSPKQFLQYLTRERARARLLSGDQLLEASIDAGLSSTGRLHDLFVTLEAVTPGQLKSGGSGIQFHCGLHPSPFGPCFIAQTARGVHRIEFIDQPNLPRYLQDLAANWPQAEITYQPDITAATAAAIFNRDQQQPLTLWLAGSPFQFKVWEALLRIPSGYLSSYGEIANTINRPGSARAVGSAVASNPVALLIPCHRVIQAMGALGNYRWGEQRKRAIVGWEACIPKTSFSRLG